MILVYRLISGLWQAVSHSSVTPPPASGPSSGYGAGGYGFGNFGG